MKMAIHLPFLFFGVNQRSAITTKTNLMFCQFFYNKLQWILLTLEINDRVCEQSFFLLISMKWNSAMLYIFYCSNYSLLFFRIFLSKRKKVQFLNVSHYQSEFILKCASNWTVWWGEGERTESVNWTGLGLWGLEIIH